MNRRSRLSGRVLVYALFLFFLPGAATAQDIFHVRAGATGSNNGSDWNNAYVRLPDTLQRNAIYYVAEGTYPGHYFGEPASGTNWIVVRKATAEVHGSNTGWQDSFADGPTIFNPESESWLPVFTINTDYVEIDGVTGGGPGNWTAGHGFVLTGYSKSAIELSDKGGRSPKNVSNIKLSHMEWSIPSGPVAGASWAAIDASAWTGTQTPLVTNVHIDHIYSHGNYLHAYLAQFRDWVIEYCLFEGAASTASFHASMLRFDANSNGDFRYNLLWNAFADGNGGTSWFGFYGGTFTDIRIYGNVFARKPDNFGPSGVGFIYTVSSDDPSLVNCKIHNNSFINFWSGQAIYFPTSGSVDCEAFNNVFYDLKNGESGPLWGISPPVHNYNFYALPGGTFGEPSGQNGGSSSPFVDWENWDFRLNSATSPGVSLPAPFNIDMFGNVRGGDGIWDRGAVEFGTSSTSAPIITTQPVGASLTEGQTATFSVAVSGTPPLTFQWRRDGVNIAGANSASYTTAPLTLGDNGASFSVVVSNGSGSVESVDAALVVAEVVESTGISVGDTVGVIVSPSLRVRAEPKLAGAILGNQPYKAEGVVIEGPVSADGYEWWHIDYENDPDGWSIDNPANFLSKPPSTPAGIQLGTPE